ncbi:MAG: hypothetical protein KDK39_12090 [Leptospiraceae bacterium]|nr:hypothetical protein [Leptospiraceae bacterium]
MPERTTKQLHQCKLQHQRISLRQRLSAGKGRFALRRILPAQLTYGPGIESAVINGKVSDGRSIHVHRQPEKPGVATDMGRLIGVYGSIDDLLADGWSLLDAEEEACQDERDYETESNG